MLICVNAGKEFVCHIEVQGRRNQITWTPQSESDVDQLAQTLGEQCRPASGGMADIVHRSAGDFPQQDARVPPDGHDHCVWKCFEQGPHRRSACHELGRGRGAIAERLILQMGVHLQRVPQDHVLGDAQRVRRLPHDSGRRFREGQLAPGETARSGDTGMEPSATNRSEVKAIPV